MPDTGRVRSGVSCTLGPERVTLVTLVKPLCCHGNTPPVCHPMFSTWICIQRWHAACGNTGLVVQDNCKKKKGYIYILYKLLFCVFTKQNRYTRNEITIKQIIIIYIYMISIFLYSTWKLFCGNTSDRVGVADLQYILSSSLSSSLYHGGSLSEAPALGSTQNQ